MVNYVWLKHEITGAVDKYPEHYLGHPTLGKLLTLADPEGCVDCGFTGEDEAFEPETETEVLEVEDTDASEEGYIY